MNKVIGVLKMVIGVVLFKVFNQVLVGLNQLTHVVKVIQLYLLMPKANGVLKTTTGVVFQKKQIMTINNQIMMFHKIMMNHKFLKKI